MFWYISYKLILYVNIKIGNNPKIMIKRKNKIKQKNSNLVHSE